MNERAAAIKSVPEIPTFQTVESHRLHVKQRLAGAFRVLAHYGYDEGIAGIVTVRDPGSPDLFWVNPLGLHFSEIRVSDLILVDSSGRTVEGARYVNEAAFMISKEIHAARPDVLSVIHTHSLYGQAWSSLGRLLDPITQNACRFFEHHSLYDEFDGLVLKNNQGAAIAESLGQNKGVILCNHGLLTVGETVDETTWWFIMMERACQIQLLAEAAGRPRAIDAETARKTRAQLGSPIMGWYAFQPLYDMMEKNQPGFLS